MLVSHSVEYKKAFTPNEVETIIETNSGIYFDPLIADVFDDDEVKKSFADTAARFV
jgi:HD-GYP domain-containing protein (c-di-GMP phosphodiesterase class II)